MQILKAGVVYFALVFGAGFLLGTIRVLCVATRFGTRTAELMEAPIMFVVTILAARQVARRLSLPPTPAARLGVGFVALGFLLAVEFVVVLRLRGLTMSQYLAERDPVAGTVYIVVLGVFAVMPLLQGADEIAAGSRSCFGHAGREAKAPIERGQFARRRLIPVILSWHSWRAYARARQVAHAVPR